MSATCWPIQTPVPTRPPNWPASSASSVNCGRISPVQQLGNDSRCQLRPLDPSCDGPSTAPRARPLGSRTLSAADDRPLAELPASRDYNPTHTMQFFWGDFSESAAPDQWQQFRWSTLLTDLRIGTCSRFAPVWPITCSIPGDFYVFPACSPTRWPFRGEGERWSSPSTPWPFHYSSSQRDQAWVPPASGPLRHHLQGTSHSPANDQAPRASDVDWHHPNKSLLAEKRWIRQHL